MKYSTERILTTHVGSLPRPDDLTGLLEAMDRNEAVDQAEYQACTSKAVMDAVKAQVKADIDIVSDGEMSKMS
jgi:5-methyltetrahydropteroyltriglutamate--homocysteine methyltransferase